ncbi:YraN family protein, partial [Phocaeicola vulgatus]|uniref:YraN family protein n=1 Tax=Phocaeicola vulgatus TaxID=821 RepID=UPI0032BFDE00
CEGNLVHKSRRDVSVPENNGHTGKKGWLGMLFSADDADNKDNSLETDPFADWQQGDTCYKWQANGMLAGVRTPDGRTVTFGYDALGRRVSKRTGDTVHRFGWDGNVVLHEWDIEEADRPKLVTDETGSEEYDGTEKPANLVTWVYDGTSFTPVAKVTDGERHTIVHDYLGTPTQAYDSKGELVWEMLLDVYGKVKECHGDRTLVPFRYQGQYEDEETGLYYNRFRYYSPEMGMYISSDPIGLAGNNPTLYGYVEDVNTWLDEFGLAVQMVDGVPMGDWGEKVAAKYLEKQGHTILGSIQNSSGHGFDLITKTQDGNINIIEVKTGKSKPAGKANMADWTNRNIDKISRNTNGRWGNKPKYQNNLINIIRDARAKGKLKNKLVQINIDKRSIKITCK